MATSGFDPLTFSKDTLFFDTVFNQIETPVRRLWVRNPNRNAVEADIALENADGNSPYALVINGQETNRLANVRILGEDSVLILVNANIEEQSSNEPLLIEDFIVLETEVARQRIPVHAWGRNARLLRDYNVTSDETWTPERPYVLLNNLIIDSLATLTLEAGVEVYGYPNAFFLVGGSLRIQGTAENPVRLTGLRQEAEYQNAAGQWGGIVTAQGSQLSEIVHAHIRNAVWGVRAGTPDNDTLPDVRIAHTIIENMADAGVLAFGSDVVLENTLINNCLNQTFAGLAGGYYRLDHVTLANFSFDFLRQDPSVAFANLFEAGGTRFEEDLTLICRNSILWGSLEEEIFISEEGNGEVSLLVANSILKTQQNERFDRNENLLNQDPRFVSPILYDYRLDTLSPAQDAGRDIGLPTDLNGKARNLPPDIGAYEYRDSL